MFVDKTAPLWYALVLASHTTSKWGRRHYVRLRTPHLLTASWIATVPNLRRRKSTRPPSVRWNIYVPFDIAAIIDNEFWSAAYGKPMYGRRQELVIKLLRDYIAEHKLAEQPLRLGAPASTQEPHDV